MLYKYLPKALFLFFLVLQVLNENREYFKILHSKIPRLPLPLNYIQFSIFATAGLLIVFYIARNKDIKEKFSKTLNKRIKLNNVVLFLILFYCLYEGIFVNALAYTESGMVIQEVVLLNLPRLIFIVVPSFYFFVLPGFKDCQVPIKWVNISGVFLIIIIMINFTILGTVSHTDEGSLRLANGEVAVIYVFMLVTSFGYFSGLKMRVIFVGTALLGIIAANHKSGYLAVALVGFINLFNVKIKNKKLQTLATSFALLMIVTIPLSQTESFSKIIDGFIVSLEASTDLKSKAVKEREERWEKAWECFLENPVNGTKFHNKHYLTTFAGDHTPHNFIYSILASQGVTGFGMIVLILLSTFWIIIKNRADKITWQMAMLILFYLFFAYANVVFFNEACYFMLPFSIAMILHRNKLLGDFERYDEMIVEVANARNDGVKVEEFESIDEDYQYLGKYCLTNKGVINYEGLSEWLIHKYESSGEILSEEKALEHLHELISVEKPAPAFTFN